MALKEMLSDHLSASVFDALLERLQALAKLKH